MWNLTLMVSWYLASSTFGIIWDFHAFFSRALFRNAVSENSEESCLMFCTTRTNTVRILTHKILTDMRMSRSSLPGYAKGNELFRWFWCMVVCRATKAERTMIILMHPLEKKRLGIRAERQDTRRWPPYLWAS